MPAQVDQMFSVREAPWHLGVETTEKQTRVLGEYPGREEAMRLAGHDFEVLERPAMFHTAPEDNWAAGQSVISSKYKVLVNSRTGQDIAFVKVGYEVIQPSVLYDLTEAILEADDQVLWETGGTLRGGEILWILARVNRPFFVTGDDSPIFPFVAGSTHNDGKGSLKFQNIMTRIVCYNTWNAAQQESQRTGREFVFRHVKNVRDRIEQAKAVLAGATRQAQAFQELAEELAKMPFSDKAIERFVVEFIPSPPETLISDRVAANIEAARDKVRRLFFESPTVNDSIRHTAYGALCVGIEYLDHLRPYKSRNTYLGRTLLRPETLKNRLVPLVKRIADEHRPLAHV